VCHYVVQVFPVGEYLRSVSELCVLPLALFLHTIDWILYHTSSLSGTTINSERFRVLDHADDIKQPFSTQDELTNFLLSARKMGLKTMIWCLGRIQSAGWCSHSRSRRFVSGQLLLSQEWAGLYSKEHASVGYWLLPRTWSHSSRFEPRKAVP